METPLITQRLDCIAYIPDSYIHSYFTSHRSTNRVSSDIETIEMRLMGYESSPGKG